MSRAEPQTNKLIAAEEVILKDETSRLSSAIFFLLCFIPVFSTVLFGAVDNTTWIFLSALWLGIILLWLAESWRTGGMLLDVNSLLLPIGGLIAIAFIQIIPVGGSTISQDQYPTRFFLLRLLIYVVFFAGCLTYINTEKRYQKVVLLVVVFGAAMGFFGILQRLANPDGIYGIRETPQARPFGPFVNQHHFAAFMNMTCGVALGLLFGKETTRDKRILLGIAVVVMGAATAMTSSRGGVLAFLSVLGAVTLFNLLSGKSRRKESTPDPAAAGRRIGIAFGGLAIIVSIILVVSYVGGSDAMFRGIGVASAGAEISSGRLHFWPIAFQIFLAHPILGAGFDAFGAAFTRYDTLNGLLRVDQAHNEYLQTLAEAGVAGIVCVGAFIFILFRKAIGRVTTANGLMRDAAVGAAAGCFGILVHSVVDFPLRTSSNAFFFLLLAAIATVSVSVQAKRRRTRSSKT